MARAISLGARGYLTKSSAQSLMLDACRQVAAGKTYIDPKFGGQVEVPAAASVDPTEDLLRESFRYFLLWLKGLQCPLSPNASVLAQKLWVCITQV